MDYSGMDYSGLPESLQGGMRRYVEEGVVPGRFLAAVLENDLGKSFGYADENSQARLPTIVKWLYNNAPNGCWGSVGRVRGWSRHRGMQGTKHPRLVGGD